MTLKNLVLYIFKDIHHFRLLIFLRIYCRLSTIFKTSKKVYEVMLFDIWKYVYSESVFNTLYIDTLYTIQYTLYSSQFYFQFAILIWAKAQSWSQKKLCVGFSIFDSASFLLNFVFLFNKMHVLFDFKTS